MSKVNHRFVLIVFLSLCCSFLIASNTPKSPYPFPTLEQAKSRVSVVYSPRATAAFLPNPDTLNQMVETGLTDLTGQEDIISAWHSLLKVEDIIGIKVFSGPGPVTGTNPRVIEAVIISLIKAGFKPGQIILWDKRIEDLARSELTQFRSTLGIQVLGAKEEGWDSAAFYDSSLLGRLVWGDWEFGEKGQGIGRRSYISKLLTQKITKIINITPMLNDYHTGVSGNLYSLAMGSVDNTIRFDDNTNRLATAVPEIYAIQKLGDRVVMNIVDALVCQFQGNKQEMLHYSVVLNELRFSRDPVALDVLSLQELTKLRRQFADKESLSDQEGNTLDQDSQYDLYTNASLLQIGVSKQEDISVKRIHLAR
ncbi:MAG TPA: DUF362 domain-containing protein [Verrucomicrobiales bacterium]|nr:DUF362 domain-containing protein [Verrucomicrobiales bacterium]HIL72471.1 DUF362 domain-containing protein [Verrucomicrobiota bacterium]